MAILALQDGDNKKGLKLALRAVNLYGEMGIVMGSLALIYYHLDDTREAHTSVREALQVVRKTHNLGALLWTLPPSVLLLLELGYPENALETYTALTHIPTYQGSRWIEDLLGEHIRNLQGKISPDEQEAVRQRGETIDPFDLASELLELFTSLEEHKLSTVTETPSLIS